MVAMAVALAIGVFSAAAADEGWHTYQSDKYGFKMLTPSGVQFKEKEHGGGWGALEATHESIKFLAVGKLGEQANPEEIEKFGVNLTGVGAGHWKQVDKGQNKNGWKWYHTVEATDGKTLLFGGYGTGPKGSYLILLQTTVKDYEEHKADYHKWYNSITLF